MQNRPSDFYDVLDIRPTHDLDEIRNAYKAKLQAINSNDPGYSENAFNALQDAFEFLRDTNQREDYFRRHPDVSDEQRWNMPRREAAFSAHAGREESLMISIPEEHPGFMSLFVPIYTPGHFDFETGHEQEMEQRPEDYNAVSPGRFLLADQFDYAWLANRLTQLLAVKDLVAATDPQDADNIFSFNMRNTKLFYYAELLVPPSAIQINSSGLISINKQTTITANQVYAVRESARATNANYNSSFYNGFIAKHGHPPFAESTYDMYQRNRNENAWQTILNFVNDKLFWSPLTAIKSFPTGVDNMKDELTKAVKLQHKNRRVPLSSYVDANQILEIAKRQSAKASANRHPITGGFYDQVIKHIDNPSVIATWIEHQYALQQAPAQAVAVPNVNRPIEPDRLFNRPASPEKPIAAIQQNETTDTNPHALRSSARLFERIDKLRMDNNNNDANAELSKSIATYTSNRLTE